MGVKRLAAGQKELDHKLLTLWRGGYIQLVPDPRDFGIEGTFEQGQAEILARKKAEPAQPKTSTFGAGIFDDLHLAREPQVPEQPDSNVETPEPSVHGLNGEEQPVYEPKSAYPTPRLPEFLKLRGINPLYGLFLLNHFSIADRAERIQALESVLELPTSIGRFVRVPKQRDLPPGPLATGRLDKMLLDLGLATVDELVEKTEEEQKEDWERRRRAGIHAEDPVFVLKLAEKLKRLFDYEYPGVEVRVNAVWAAGDILLEFHGDFNKYITSNSLQKQEGVIFRHLLRMILLLEELSELTPSEMNAETWKAELAELGNMLVECCRKVDPSSTEETLNFSKAKTIADAI